MTPAATTCPHLSDCAHEDLSAYGTSFMLGTRGIWLCDACLRREFAARQAYVAAELTHRDLPRASGDWPPCEAGVALLAERIRRGEVAWKVHEAWFAILVEFAALSVPEEGSK